MAETRDIATSDIAGVLSDWLSPRHERSKDFTLRSVSSPEANGFSAITHIVEAEWLSGAEPTQAKYVIRQQSMSEDELFPDQDFLGIARAQKILSALPNLKIPEVLWIEEDQEVLGSPFFVMPFVDGLIPSDNPPLTVQGWAIEASDNQRLQMTRSTFAFLKQLYAVDPDEIGVSGILSRVQDGGLEIAGDLDYYDDFICWGSNGDIPDIGRAASQWLHDRVPVSERRAISWGDARYGNVIFRNFELVAALDWEMATIADPAKDVGFLSYLNRYFTHGIGISPVCGFPFGKESAALFTDCTEIELPDFEFYEVFAAYRSLTILVRHVNVMIRRGVNMGGLTTVENPPAAILRALMDEYS